ncbi:MAG: HAD family phosphatase [Verrucomicrobiota bacterium]
MMPLRYRCLILDHDDTAVNSTAMIHYPAHLEAMRVMRPGMQPVALEGWFLKNFHPGILAFLEGELGMTQEELATEFNIWRAFNAREDPEFFPDFLELLVEYRQRGGRIVVASHSERDTILRHYRKCGMAEVEPDLVFGWDADPERRKPSPWPVLETLRHLGIAPNETLVLDDLKPGVLMAQRAGVPVAGAGWAHRIPQIREYMQQNCVAYFEEIAQFKSFLLGLNSIA